MTFLIVKLSSLGDVIQALSVIPALKRSFPAASIDWAVEERFAPLLRAHPLIDQVIGLDISGWKKNPFRFPSFAALRKKEYSWVFDLQGNTKSALITCLAKSKRKGGFGKKTAREYLNPYVTNCHVDPDPTSPIRHQHLLLLSSCLNTPLPFLDEPISLTLTPKEKEEVAKLTSPVASFSILVCPGSRWKNKQLPTSHLVAYLKDLEKKHRDPHFFFSFGSLEEEKEAKVLQSHFPRSTLSPPLSLPAWQSLIAQVDLVIGVDSSALHLAATTSTPTIAFFGPTSSRVFNPPGERHLAIQGSCPYSISFLKQCPRLRTCKTGACMKNLTNI